VSPTLPIQDPHASEQELNQELIVESNLKGHII